MRKVSAAAAERKRTSSIRHVLCRNKRHLVDADGLAAVEGGGSMWWFGSCGAPVRKSPCKREAVLVAEAATTQLRPKQRRCTALLASEPFVTKAGRERRDSCLAQ